MSKRIPDEIRVQLRRSPRQDKKWRVTILDTGRTVDFGASGSEDFTIHKDAPRMIRYLVRHAGNVSDRLKRNARDGKLSDVQIVEAALNVVATKSKEGKGEGREKWGSTDLHEAVHKAGFWSRWLLWSVPSLQKAKRLIEKKFYIRFV